MLTGDSRHSDRNSTTPGACARASVAMGSPARADEPSEMTFHTAVSAFEIDGSVFLAAVSGPAAAAAAEAVATARLEHSRAQ